MQWAYVSDLAEACVRALEVPGAAGQAFNIAHEPTTQRGFVELLARVSGVEPSGGGAARADPGPRRRATTLEPGLILCATGIKGSLAYVEFPPGAR